MATFSALYYHLIWSTKNREQLIHPVIEDKLHRYIAGIISAKKGNAIQIGGMPDHIHILLRTNPDTNISNLVKDIKINSTKWLKQNIPNNLGFSWQEGYGVFSVSKSNTDAVKDYILNQRDHHKTATFENELIIFLGKHGVSYDPKYIFT